MPYNIGAIGPRPCELHSRWRRYALTSRDQLRDRKVSWWKHLTVEDIGGGKFVWKVDGNIRTVTTSPPVGIDGTALTLGARHKIIHEQGSSWQVDCVGEYNMIHNMYLYYVYLCGFECSKVEKLSTNVISLFKTFF